MLAFAIFFIGLSARFLDHVPNFTPILALALFGGAYLPKRQALWLPIVIMGLTDIILGFHPTMPFTWGCLMFIAWLGYRQRSDINIKRVTGSAVLGSIVFFLATNFGVWLFYHPLTWAGLVECYTLAIPFYRTTLISCVVYSWAFFGMYDLVSRRLPQVQKV